MNLFDEIQKKLADANDDVHIVIFGKCTMTRSPGIFCKVKDNGGVRTLALGEGSTCESAMAAALEKLRPAPAILPMPNENAAPPAVIPVFKLPGMV